MLGVALWVMAVLEMARVGQFRQPYGVYLSGLLDSGFHQVGPISGSRHDGYRDLAVFLKIVEEGERKVRILVDAPAV